MSDTKVDATIRETCADVDVDFDDLEPRAVAALRAMFELGRSYGLYVAEAIRAGLVAQVDKLEGAQREGFQMAIQAIASLEVGSDDGLDGEAS